MQYRWVGRMAVAFAATSAAILASFGTADTEPQDSDSAKAAASQNSGVAYVDPEVAGQVREDGSARVVVSFFESGKPPETDAAVAAESARVAGARQRTLSAVDTNEFEVRHTFKVVPAVSGVVTEEGLEVLASQPDVARISLDRETRASLTEAVALVNGDDTHALGVTGAGVVVAVLDTGIDTDHPNLSDDLILQRCYLFDGTCPGGGTTGTSAEDGHGHGTHVSGIITSSNADARGIAPDAQIAAYKILADSGNGYFSDVVAAMDDIIVNQPSVDIINMSLGSFGTYAPGSCEAVDPALTSAIATLKAQGVTVFAASGNSFDAGGTSLPACINNVISVGATYDANVGAGYCGEPTVPDLIVCFSNSDPSLDLVAPGSLITSTVTGGGLATFQGTSMASPMAAGVAALLKSDEPLLAPSAIEARLKATGVPVLDARNNVTACRVNALAAVQNTVPAPPCATAVVGPPNDNAIDALPFAPPNPRSQSNFGATRQAGEPQACGGIGSTVWFQYTAPATATVTLHTAGSTFDTALAMYVKTGPGTLGTFLGCNDDTGGTLQSKLTLGVTVGTTYYIQAGGFNGNQGLLTLSMPPSNDDFAGRRTLLPPPTPWNQSTAGASTEINEPLPCNMGGATVWFSFVAPMTGFATAQTAGSSFDTVIGAYDTASSPSGQLNLLNCNDDAGGTLQSAVDLPVTSGTTYYVQAGGYVGQSGDLTLELSFGSSCFVPNDNFFSATFLIAPTSTSQCTTGASIEGGEPLPCGMVGKTAWFTFFADEDAVAIISTFGSDYDTVVAAYDAADSPPGQLGTLLACNDDAGGASQSEVLAQLVEGRQYFVQAGSRGALGGSLSLNVSTASLCLPPNDHVGNASTLVSGGFDTQCTGGAGVEAGENLPCGIGSTVWYRYDATADGVLEVNVNADFNTVLAAYEGMVSPPGVLGYIACNDDVQPGDSSSGVAIGVQAGRSYYFQVGGLGGATGELSIYASLRPGCVEPQNQQAAARVALGNEYNLVCTIDATLQAGESQPCGAIGASLWYRITPNISGTMNVAVEYATFDTVLAAYQGLPAPGGGGPLLTCNDNGGAFAGASAISFNATAGVQYYLQVGGASGAAGMVSFRATCVADTDCDGVLATDNCGIQNQSQVNTDNGPLLTPGRPNDVTVAHGEQNNVPLGAPCDIDSDNDNLLDFEEPQLVSPPGWPRPCAPSVGSLNVLNADTDGDRVIDFAECRLGSNPLSAASKPPVLSVALDPDRDRLSTAFEESIGSDPNDLDTDDDGFSDLIEYFGYGTALWSVDTDNDNCSDGIEIASVDTNTAVNSNDLLIVALQFGTPALVPDINKDGTVNPADLGLVARNYGNAPVIRCGDPLPG